jgi:predicted nucleic acid-binding Zn ribbon protein
MFVGADPTCTIERGVQQFVHTAHACLPLSCPFPDCQCLWIAIFPSLLTIAGTSVPLRLCHVKPLWLVLADAKNFVLFQDNAMERDVLPDRYAQLKKRRRRQNRKTIALVIFFLILALIWMGRVLLRTF